MSKENVVENEKLFRILLANLEGKGFPLPENVNSEAPLENILGFVTDNPVIRPSTGFHLSFQKGPFEFCGKEVSESQVAFGYCNMGFMSGGGAVSLYDIVDEDKVKYNSDIFTFMS